MVSLIVKYFQQLSAVFAFLVWGGWAFYVNQALAINSRLIVATAQGVFSLLVTLIVITVVSAIYKKMATNQLRFIVPGTVMAVVTAVILVVIHSYIGTAEIALTISPGIFMTFVFSILTSFKLNYAANKGGKKEEIVSRA